MSSLKIVLHQRDKIAFKGGVEAVTGINELGEFDILKNHAHLITMIKDKLILRQKKGFNQEHKIKSGILVVEDNVVEVFLGL